MIRKPIPISGGSKSARSYLDSATVSLDNEFLEHLRGACGTVTAATSDTAEAGRDWWPLAMEWATRGAVPMAAGAVVRPSSHDEVCAVLALCNSARIPVTVAGGRSGVCGGAIPVNGGVAMDMRSLAGIRSVDTTSLVVDVGAGTIGSEMDHELRSRWEVTVGHRPQSVAISTVGGWLACRSAGQYSTRYGKIEDIVVGLDVVTADGRTIHTGGQPRQATGPDLNQLFVGSEGTLGIITAARLRLHPKPTHERHMAFGFSSFNAGLDACRRIMRRGATPAVLRLYDQTEGHGNFATGKLHPLLVLDEGDDAIVTATMDVVANECGDAERLDDAIVEKWLTHRDEVSALGELISQGYVVDTMEVAGTWLALEAIHADVTRAIAEIDGTLIVSAHQSHAYVNGACLYFTFVGKPDGEKSNGDYDSYYRAVWDAGTRATLAAGGALSHHHGVGLNRSRFMSEALGEGLGVLAAVKDALDPYGILNPGKLGLSSPFGDNVWSADNMWSEDNRWSNNGRVGH